MKKLYFEGMMQMEERSLRITGADKTFFTKITNALTKILIPTKIGINGMLISIKIKREAVQGFFHFQLGWRWSGS